MPKALRKLEKMRANPKADWIIDDVKALCWRVGLSCQAPSSGSHYTVSSPYLDGILTVPAARPIKPHYIKSLVAMVDAHRELAAKQEEE